jgi:hypothetical protein
MHTLMATPRGHALGFSVKSTVPVSRVKVAVHAKGIACHRLVQKIKITNYIKFHVSLTIPYYKNIYSSTGSGIPLYLGFFETGLSDKVVEAVSDLSLFC